MFYQKVTLASGDEQCKCGPGEKLVNNSCVVMSCRLILRLPYKFYYAFTMQPIQHALQDSSLVTTANAYHIHGNVTMIMTVPIEVMNAIAVSDTRNLSDTEN
jgi:hypothetical protein